MLQKVFDVNGTLNRVLGLAWKLIGLNVMFLALCLPVVTAGPALLALWVTLFKVVAHTDNGVAREFFRAFAQRFWRGLAFELATVALFAGLGLGIYALLTLSRALVFAVVLMVGLAVAILLSLAVFLQLTAKDQAPWPALIGEAVRYLMGNVVITIVMFVSLGVTLLWPIFGFKLIFLWLLFGVSGIAYLDCLMVQTYSVRLA
ncbi:DUF624 domain-containing protein [Lacticaseibacillus kribbianus]|uniref:DUF624 domain-containing protein n=1 Tax=Lacticaseibacillus kribbianus TaxID=2926292 RepID=UPI001CD5B204|nr:DUF624 domain-containing protein [Lacticaseibacillus kribbianus]